MVDNLLESLTNQLHLSADSRLVLEVAQQSAKDHIGTEHLLFGLLEIEQIRFLVEDLGIDYGKLVAATGQYIIEDPNHPETLNEFTPTTLKALIAADQERSQRGDTQTTPVDLLLGMLSVKVGRGFLQLWEALHGHEPIIEEREQNKIDLMSKVRDLSKKQ